MKSIALIVAIAALSCGCSSIPFTNRPDPGIDTAKMARVENAAAGRGVGIYWVNPPLRKASTVVAPAAPTGT